MVAIRLVLLFLAALTMRAALNAQGAEAQIPGTESVSAVFSLGQRIAGYDSSRQALRIFSCEGESLREDGAVAVEGSVSAVTALPNGYAVATGMGRDNPSAPIRIAVFTTTDSIGKVVFERMGERNQINTIIWRDGKLWLNFFTSKYITAIGYLTPTQTGDWKFTELTSVRMGDSLDVVGDLTFVGRSYGDIQGQDGDLLLFKGNERVLLPSYRGVRSVRVVGDVVNHRVFIGDGWHMNYGQLAQGRLSVVSRRPEDSRYTLQILDYDPSTTDFRRLIPFRTSGREHIAALGSSSVVVYDQQGVLAKKTLYEQTSQTNLMDMTVVQTSPDKALMVVADQGLRTLQP
jgi:hypothetical protein